MRGQPPVRPTAAPAALRARELLRDLPFDGYPVEYFLARVRGRRSRLVTAWRRILLEPEPLEHLSAVRYSGFIRELTPAGVRRALRREHAWLYRQMDEGLRETFAPYFAYAEFGTILDCLRDGLAGRGEERFDASILSEDLVRALKAAERENMLKTVEAAFSRRSAAFSGIADIFRLRGLRAVERELISRFFGAVLASYLHPVMRRFMQRLIDARNVLALFQSLRTPVPDADIFIAGGTIAAAHLDELRLRGDVFPVLTLIKKTWGVTVETPDPTSVETALYRGITRQLAAEARDPLGYGMILQYLWKCSLEVTNMSILLAGKSLDRERVAAELVW